MRKGYLQGRFGAIPLSEVTPDEQDAKEYDPNKVKRRKRNRLFISSAKEKKQRHFISNISFTKLPGGYYPNSIKT